MPVNPAKSALTRIGRGRLFVIQVLVMSLFVTLFARLWYVQVIGGDTYQAQAAQNSLRSVIVQPQRGLIVDDVGRPLATNRLSWQVTVDRDVLDALSPSDRAAVLQRVATVTGQSVRQVDERLKTCGDPGAPRPPVCWNGSPYQPVPVAQDVPQQVAITIAERGEAFPGVDAQQVNVRAYPSPFGVNAAQLLGYLTPITGPEYAQAQARNNPTLNATSLVGRTGLESEYDRFLRGVPGSDGVTVDSMGRKIGDAAQVPARPGDTLVTSIDARVQSVVEHQLRNVILTARKTRDPVTGRNYAAPAGAALVMSPKDGRVIAMASYPTYNPNIWVGGISDAELAKLYAPKAHEPLLNNPIQAQLAPGSTFKPVTTAGALTHGYSPATRLDCSSSFMVGSRLYKNYESAAYGMIGFDQALPLSCDTFFYRIGYAAWLKEGGDSATVRTKDWLTSNAKAFGFGRPTGVDLPGEAAGRIADRRWKLAYWKQNKGYYCKVGKQPGYDYLHVFAREFCTDGWRFRAGDAVNFAIGQGDTTLTPLQLATAYAAISNGGTLWAPRVGKAIFSPSGRLVRRIPPHRVGRVPIPRKDLHHIDQWLLGTSKFGTMAWKMGGFPLNQVKIRAKTGTAEVYGKQTTSWVSTYDKDYVVVMMVEQGGTGSGTSGDAIRHIWESLYGIHGTTVDRAKGDIPGAVPPRRLPRFTRNGSIEPPAGMTVRCRPC
ncbi:MAG: penicillin-binding protein 2 [Nocardioidaceae bacterium]